MTAVGPAEVAVRRLQQLESAWNAADGAAFGAAFGPDADFVDIRGEHHQGGVAVGKGHQAIFGSIYAGSTVRYTLESARLIAPGCVVAVAGSELDAPVGPLQGVNHSRFTVVLTDHHDDWLITAFHNTLIASGA